MSEPIDLAQATIHHSPADIASWRRTVQITHVREDPRGGFELTFDRTLPENWKWPSNPAVPSDNFQFTVWAFVQVGGRWHGAGFVQMWQGRSMKMGALPAIFTVNDGAVGYTNWWADVRHLWGEMSDYVPRPGDTIGLMASAGNARLVDGVTSVQERSNVVVFTLPANDVLDVAFDDHAPPPGPGPLPLPKTDLAAVLDMLTAILQALATNHGLLVTIRDQQLANRGRLEVLATQFAAAVKRIEAKLPKAKPVPKGKR